MPAGPAGSSRGCCASRCRANRCRPAERRERGLEAALDRRHHPLPGPAKGVRFTLSKEYCKSFLTYATLPERHPRRMPTCPRAPCPPSHLPACPLAHPPMCAVRSVVRRCTPPATGNRDWTRRRGSRRRAKTPRRASAAARSARRARHAARHPHPPRCHSCRPSCPNFRRSKRRGGGRRGGRRGRRGGQ